MVQRTTIGDGPRWFAKMQDNIGNSVCAALSNFGGPLEETDKLSEIRKSVAQAIIDGSPVSFTWEVNGVKYPGMFVTEIVCEGV